MSALSKCASCRLSLQRAFVSFPDLPIRTALKPNTTKVLFNAFDPLTSIRPFTSISPRRSDDAHQKNISPTNVQDEPDQDIPEPVSQTPWYLQVETPQREIRSLSERQQLPELPSDPPPLLLSILEHISIDLGLDELSLFDLRKLDPPPALGANLLMILGTARSKKHLQVSADRFCRWLRTEHKLTPYADGLMGRGELKLKLKRKARRARILSRVGSSERYSQDDGLTTGWICVNVGTIEDGKGASEGFLEPEGFVGFGEKVGGTKVVIQMLTEEKRMELDLEEMWENMLKKQGRKEAKITKSSEAAINHGLSDQKSLQEQNLSSNASSVIQSYHQKPSVSNYQQRREFHNSASHQEPNHIDQIFAEIPHRNIWHDTPKKPNPDPESLNPASKLTKPPDIELKNLDLERKQNPGKSKTPESDKKLLDLRASLKYLMSLSREDAIEVLGTGIDDWGSTSFLASFYKSYPSFPQSDHWECRFALVCHAIRIGHPEYNKRNLMVLVNEMRATIADISLRLVVHVIDTLLSRDAPAQSVETMGMGYSFGTLDFEEYLTLLDHSRFVPRHDSPVQEDDSRYVKKIAWTLYAATAYASENKLIGELKSDVIVHLRLYMDLFSNEPMDTHTDLTVLNIFALKNNWEAFWAHWNGIARRMWPKPAELYTLMFHRVAETKNQIQCIDVLRNLVPEMALEMPPVRLEGPVAKAVMECLRIVSPDPRSGLAKSNWYHEARWTALWRLCESGTRHSDSVSEHPSSMISEGVESEKDFVPLY